MIWYSDIMSSWCHGIAKIFRHYVIGQYCESTMFIDNITLWYDILKIHYDIIPGEQKKARCLMEGNMKH